MMHVQKESRFMLLIGSLGETQTEFNQLLGCQDCETCCVDLFSLLENEELSLFSLIEVIEQYVIAQDKIFFFLEGIAWNQGSAVWVKHFVLTIANILQKEQAETEFIIIDAWQEEKSGLAKSTHQRYVDNISKALAKMNIKYSVVTSMSQAYLAVL